MAARPGIDFPKGIGVPISPAVVMGPGSINLWAGAVELAWEHLTDKEITVFARDLVKLAGYFSQSRDLQTIFLEDRDVYLYALSIAKKQLAAGFGGVSAGSGEIGMQLIRSLTLLNAANWLQTIDTTGWNDIFGTADAPINLGATTGYGEPQNRVCICFPKLMDLTVPKITEAWFHIGPTNYQVFPMGFFSIADLFVAKLPAAVYVGKNGTFYMRGNIIGNGVVEGIAPLGLTFALAEYMVGSGAET